MKTVTFCGHKDVYLRNEEKEKLRQVIIEQIEDGATRFLLGGYGRFDGICAVLLYELKKQYPHIISILVIPYLDKKYNLDLYDFSEYPPLEFVPRRFAILKRNEYMVEQSQMVIAYINHDWGGAFKTFSYAKRKKKAVIQLGDYEH